MRQTLALTAACLLSLLPGIAGRVGTSSASPNQGCGHPATQPVSYYGPSADIPTFFITRAANGAGAFTVYVEGPLASRHPSRKVGNWKTSDGGSHWTRSNAIPSGHLGYPIMGIGSAASNPKIMYASGGIPGGAMSRSLDGGRTWAELVPTIRGLPAAQFALSVSANPHSQVSLNLKAIDPLDPMSVYAGIDVLVPDPKIEVPTIFPVRGIYVSHDGGQSWNLLSNAVSGNSRFGPLGISPLHPRVMYGIDDDGIVQKSTDGGLSWTRVGEYEALRTAPVFAMKSASGWRYITHPRIKNAAIQWVFDPRDDTTVYFVSDKGIYRTTNGGRSWRLLNLGFDEKHGVTSVVANPLKPEQIFVAAADFGIFRSDDRGCHFVDITPPEARHPPLPPRLPPPAAGVEELP